jgi:hypothetical protein
VGFCGRYSAYDEAGRAASADVIKAERSKAVDVADYRIVEEFLRFKKFSLMVRRWRRKTGVVFDDMMFIDFFGVLCSACPRGTHDP